MAWFTPDPLEELKSATERLQSTVTNLSRDNALLAAVLTNMAEGVIAVDPQSHVLIMNPTLGNIFGVKPDEARGRLFLEVIRHNQLNDLIQKTLKESKPQSIEAHIFLDQDLRFAAHSVPLIDQGQVRGALLVLRDVTEVRHLEKVRRDFVANVSHELRTPLASIKGFAETLRDGALNDRDHALEFLESIEKHADNMIELVQDLLDLTVIESGQRPPQLGEVDIANAVSAVVQHLKPIARKKNVALENKVEGPLPRVKADEQHVRQILRNLMENAIKFHEANGWVRVSAEVQGNTVRLNVSDNGPGIPAQDISRIFERFYRSDLARSRDHGGTGLGLSIVKHLVEANHGTVSVESSVGKGSTFSVDLPVI